MQLRLRTAVEAEREFCESLARRNMDAYLAARAIPWDPRRFRVSWATFENLMITDADEQVGTLRLLPEPDGLALRDLQLLPRFQRRGIGTWATQQAQRITIDRGYARLQLRVYAENPARTLYARLGFRAMSEVDGTLHMVWEASAATSTAGTDRMASPHP